MKLTNNEIYNYATALNENFVADKEIKLPIKVNFFLQKNIKTILEAAQEIDKARMEIIQTYGSPTEDGQSYEIPSEKVDIASNELIELFSIEQEIPVHKFNLDDFNNIELTTGQTAALFFMINDEEDSTIELNKEE